jgi:hypothetical protein
MTEPADPGFAALVALVGRIAQILEAGDDPAARSSAAATVEELRTLAAQRGSGGAHGVDLAQLGEALAAFAEWLRAPTPEREARAERAMSDLQAVLGRGLGWDPARVDAERRVEYRRQARAALDEIFPEKPRR